MSDPEAYVAGLSGKPCPRCAAIVVTWANANSVRFCDPHLGEVMREIGLKSAASSQMDVVFLPPAVFEDFTRSGLSTGQTVVEVKPLPTNGSGDEG